MPVWINEFHYDNAGTDAGEFIEIAASAGTDLTGWTVVRYNGANGQAYTSPGGVLTLSGVVSDETGTGFGFRTITLPVDGLQNGAPDGFALVNAQGQVVQFLSYEGTFAATSGPALGMTSVDIGVVEPGNATGTSISLTGSGTQYGDFNWVLDTNDTPGQTNNGQSFGGVTPPTVSVSDATVTEGDAGASTLTFTVTRTGGTGAFTVGYATADGTATAGVDYTAASGTLSFAAGETSKTVSVTVSGDTTVEASETLFLNLSGATGGAAIADSQGQGTIVNDDAPPPIVGTPWINEFHYDDAGTDTGEFIEVAGPAGLDLTGYSLVLYNGNGGAAYATIQLSGVIPNLQNGSGVLSFAASGLQNGGTSTPEADGIALVAPGGAVLEFISYEATMTAANGPAAGMTSVDVAVAELGNAEGTSIARTGTGGEGLDFGWTLSADDTPGQINGDQTLVAPTARVRVADVTVTEGDDGSKTLTFTVTRSGPTQAFTVDYATADGTASAGSDYTATSGQLSFAAGEMSKTVAVTVFGDTVIEAHETLFLNLANPTNGATLGDAQGVGTIRNDDVPFLRIYEIQGAGHLSAYDDQEVKTEGVVTAVDTNGFWMQDPTGDGNLATSDGIFVFTNTAPGVVAGDKVSVRGQVDEFGTGNNLTTTQIATPTVTKIGAGEVTATVIGQGGRQVPNAVGDDDDAYDPSTQAMDFFKSMEGMLVTLPNARATDLSDGGSTWVVTDGGAGNPDVNGRGGVTVDAGDFNPERIEVYVDQGVLPGFSPAYDMGDSLGDVTGVISYFGGDYEVVATQIANRTGPGSPADEVSALVGDAIRLTIAAYNLENLDPNDPQAKFDALAQDIVNALRSPDIIGVEEIQDADGAGGGADLSGAATAQKLIDAIVAAGGPRYEYVEVAPATAGSSGGEPGGNIRNGFLYNPDRVDYVEGSARLVSPEDEAYAGSRKPLAADFVFRGETVTAIDLHSTSRIGSDEGIFGDRQPPVNAGEDAREAQSEAVQAFVQQLLAADPTRHVAVMGDFNGFQFEESLTVLEQDGLLQNLSWLLPANERYSYVFDGNSQQIDHLLVSGRLAETAEFDIVHLNSGQAGFRPTDHDPVLGRFLVNTGPSAGADAYAANEDAVLTVSAANGVLANDSDLNGDAITAILQQGPAHGALTLNADGSFTYAAAANYNGADSFTYVTRDAVGAVSQATTVALNVAAVNDAPVAVADTAAVANNQTVVIDVLANDADVDAGDIRTIVGVSATSLGGSVSIVDGKLVYAADADAFDLLLLPSLKVTDTFTYTMKDAAGATSTATVKVTVSGVLPMLPQFGTNGNDTLNGDDGINILSGGNGNDRLAGFDGSDSLNGGNGNDVLAGGGSSDVLVGENGDDTISGGDDGDLISGDNGNDRLDGDAGADLIGVATATTPSPAGRGPTRCPATTGPTASSSPGRSAAIASPTSTPVTM
ncbi:Calx-beta domain-containing protein [Phenylobacterium sp. J367]|uniref:Calx-beta domain-containing protein n=1 Tax=Phenylobacterium sp. J367 TaxID=2898435 RepID=UPI0027E278A0|nr:Calx-beta domain-containing protein [Phenylobacterium sp. J367]